MPLGRRLPPKLPPAVDGCAALRRGRPGARPKRPAGAFGRAQGTGGLGDVKSVRRSRAHTLTPRRQKE